MIRNKQKAVPIDQCRHTVHSFDGACDVIEIDSGGLMVDIPTTEQSKPWGAFLFHGLEITVAVVVGFLLAVVALAA